MTEKKPKTEDILRRLSDVLDILKRISEDLQDISKSLKMTEQVGVSEAAHPPPLAAKPSKAVAKGLEDIRMMFPENLEAMLLFEDKESYIRIKPKQYLGSDNFAKIASIVRGAGGEYISAGRDSHFRMQK